MEKGKKSALSSSFPVSRNFGRIEVQRNKGNYVVRELDKLLIYFFVMKNIIWLKDKFIYIKTSSPPQPLSYSQLKKTV